MNLKKHIVWVIPGFANGVEDDVCIPASLLLLKQLSKSKNLKISVITVHYPYRDDNYEMFDCQIHPLNGANKIFRKRKLKTKFINLFSEINERDQVDLIHSFWLTDTAVFADLTAKKYGIPHVCNLMGQDAQKGNKYFRFLKKSETHFISISEFQKNTFFNNYEVNSKVIHLGVEESPLEVEKTIDIICVGALIDLKNTIEFIKLIELIVPMVPKLKCAVVGDGPNMNSLNAEIQKRDLEKVVKMEGQISRKESLKVIASSKVLFHPSNYESFGMIFAESLAARTHVLSKNTGLAYEESMIVKYDTILDASEKVQFMLKQSLPNKKVYGIEETARNYIENVYLPILG